MEQRIDCFRLFLYLQSLKNFMTKNGYDGLFDEHEMLKYLSPPSRRRLVKCMILFISDEYASPTQAIITTVCQATIQLFSSLKVGSSKIGGIVSE